MKIMVIFILKIAMKVMIVQLTTKKKKIMTNYQNMPAFKMNIVARHPRGVGLAIFHSC
jgi:hypothetical protein